MVGPRSLRPSPALLVAILALVLATGGTSYAAVTLSRNSVSSQHIRDGQVKTSDLGGSAVTGAKVKDGSLAASDFAPAELPVGPAGPKGDPGPQGVAGPPGPPGPVDTVTVVASSLIPPGLFAQVVASCPTGMEAMGGGPDSDNPFDMVVTASSPVVGGQGPASLADGQHGAATAWRVVVGNDGATDDTFKVMVVCAG